MKPNAEMAGEKEKEKGFAKTDMERVALFQEMGYICVGDKYKAASSGVYFFSFFCNLILPRVKKIIIKLHT